MPAQLARELVITVPLPEDRGRRGDARPKIHRFRSQWVELGRRLRDFRARYGLTQTEVAAVVGAGDGSMVSQWESGATVPDGLRREQLTDLLAGRLWPALRAAALVGDGLPISWERGARWYRRASRERPARETLGGAVAAILDDLRVVDSPVPLRQHYGERDGEWARGVAARQGLSEEHKAGLRRIEDAAYGLRWLELVRRSRFDLSRPLVSQLPLALLTGQPGEAQADA